MRPLVVLAMLFVAPALAAAPVPKELRTAPTYVGTWELVTVDPQDSSKRTPAGQIWIIDAACGVAFHTPGAGFPKPAPTERFAFDPTTGRVDHTAIGGMQRMLFGVFMIRGDLMTIQLNTGSPSIRPKGFAPEPGCSTWHLRRVESAK